MDREQLMSLLAQVLSSNVGNRLTAELATGIATVVNQAWLETLRQTPPESSQG